MPNNVCALLRKPANLIRAHIIPRAFYEDIKSSDNKLLLISPNVAYPKKSPIGIYDEALLSSEADNFIGKFDHYAIELLRREPKTITIPEGEKEGFWYDYGSYDFNKLKLFFVSLLWRASASQKEEFALVNLGSYEEIARLAILEESVENLDSFNVTLGRFIDLDAHKTGGLMLTPIKTKLKGINCYYFYLGCYKVVIFCDKRRPNIPKELLIAESQNLLILPLIFEGSSEQKAAKRLVKKQNKKPRT